MSFMGSPEQYAPPLANSHPRSRAELNELQAEMDAEIERLQKQLMQLRRKRNGLSPLFSLPVDVIVKILELLAWSEDKYDMDPRPEDMYDERAWQFRRPYYHWVPVTQFCSLWRDVALGCPLLWTRIEFRCSQWAWEFIKRSKQQLVDIDTRSTFTYVHHEVNGGSAWSLEDKHPIVSRYFNERFVQSCADRVRTLFACRRFVIPDTLSSFPQLEMMTLSEWGTRPRDPNYLTSEQREPPAFQRPQLYSTQFPLSLPKLRWLKVHNSDVFSTKYVWRHTTELSSLTHLYIHLSPTLIFDHVQVRDHCPNLQLLSLSADPNDHFRFVSPEGLPASPNRVTWPSLRHLQYITFPWQYTNRIGLPLASQSVIQITRNAHHSTWAWVMQETLELLHLLFFSELTRPETFDLHIMAEDEEHWIEFVGKRLNGQLACSIRLLDRDDQLHLYFAHLLQMFKAFYGIVISRLVVSTISSEITDEAKALIGVLQSEDIMHSRDITHLTLRGSESLWIFKLLGDQNDPRVSDCRCQCCANPFQGWNGVDPDEKPLRCQFRNLFPALQELEFEYCGFEAEDMGPELEQHMVDFARRRFNGEMDGAVELFKFRKISCPTERQLERLSKYVRVETVSLIS